LYYIAQDSGGNAQANASVRILQPGTTTPIADPFFADDTTITALPNPFITASGLVDIYIDTPQRVDIGITPVGAAEQIISNIDIGSIGGSGDSNHLGPGTSSTQVGLNAASTGAQSVALGQFSTAGGDDSTALGYSATSGAQNATAVGWSATAGGQRGVALGMQANAPANSGVSVGATSAASGLSSTAIGDTAVANSQKSSSLGANSTGGHNHATAVGADATTTEANQVILGSISDFAEAPGGYVLTAVNTIRYHLRVLPDGTLTTTSHIPSTATNLLPTAEQDFETGIGAWASVSGLTSIAQSTDYAVSGTHSLKCTLSGSAAASARSSITATAVPTTVYVAQARMFYHAGAMTSGLNGTLWLEFYDNTSTIIGSATAGRTRAFFADSWVYFDCRAVAPTGTVTVGMRAGLPTGGGASSDVFYLDQCGIFAVPGAI
jgi:hypothetical protein